MKNNNKTRAAEIAKNAKTAAPVVADAIASAVVEKSAPKKNLSRADVLASNAITFDEIAVNDVILFDDAAHASAKNVAHMYKTAHVIERTKNEILASVSDAIYVFRRGDVSAFTFARRDNSPAPVAFTNTRLTLKNLVTHADVCKNFLSSKIVASFIASNKTTFDEMTAKFAAKNAK